VTIDLIVIVAPIRPVLLDAAAVSAQLGAAVADMGGAGGLVAELSRGRVTERPAYAIVVAADLHLISTSNVFEIVSSASRAIALYYAIQSGIVSVAARAACGTGLGAGSAALSVIGIAIALFGAPAE
jgi:hypothetical protein